MNEPVIVSHKQGRIGTILLNRPEAMNTFTPEFADQLDAALWAFESDPDILVIMIEAAGKNFCTGISLDLFDDKSHAGRPGRDTVFLEKRPPNWQGR